MSVSLWNEIAQWAEDDFRSMNGQIEYLLTECVKYRKKHKKKEEEEIKRISKKKCCQLMADSISFFVFRTISDRAWIRSSLIRAAGAEIEKAYLGRPR